MFMFGNKEYKKLLTQLDDDESEFEMLYGYQYIKDEVRHLIKSKKKEIQKQILEDDKKPKEILYFIMKIAIRAQIYSGEYTTPENILVPRGDSLVRLYDYVC